MTGPRVLVVDDEPQIQRFLTVALSAAGFQVQTAETGAQALRLAATGAPDLIVLDLGLPDRDGKEVLRDIRQFFGDPGDRAFRARSRGGENRGARSRRR